MSRYSREDIDRYFEHGIFAPKRLIYVGSSQSDDTNGESGTDYLMSEKAIKAITYLDTVSDKPIAIIMNNLGGDVYHGMAIYDAIVSCRCYVTIIAVGHCCSMGSIILQAADLRVISPNCVFMIHDGTDRIEGHSKNVEEWAKESAKLRNKMYSIYREKMIKNNPSITIKQVEKLCTIDKIYTPTETVSIGLADELMKDMNNYLKD